MALKHSKNSTQADGADATLVRPSDWNADHVVDDGTFTIAKTIGLQTALDGKAPLLLAVSAAVSAAGSTQGTATALTSDYNAVTTVAAGAGVILPATVVGKVVIVANKGANALLVYPPASSAIDSGTTNSAYSLATNAVMVFDGATSTLWYSLSVPASGGGTAFSWTTITSANVATAVTNTGYIMETGGTLRTVTLPASAAAGFSTSINASAGQVRVVSNGNVIDQVGAGNDLLLSDGNTVTLIAKSTGAFRLVYGAGQTAYNRIVSVISSNTTAGSAAYTDYVYLASGTTTVTLPTAVGTSNLYTIKNVGVATISIASTSAQTFDGSASPITIATANTSLTFASDGSNWKII